jgi:hypothetical protein
MLHLLRQVNYSDAWRTAQWTDKTDRECLDIMRDAMRVFFSPHVDDVLL